MSTTAHLAFDGQRGASATSERVISDRSLAAERLRPRRTRLEVGEDVVDALDADREPHQVRA